MRCETAIRSPGILTASCSMRTLVAALVLTAHPVSTATAGNELPPPPEPLPGQSTPGERLYLEGLLPTGEPVSGLLQRDVSFRGGQAVCSGCHGRSGLGTGEGTFYTPAITGRILYAAQETTRKELYASRQIRPAYTDETLKRAIRHGVDPAGRKLDDMMPRYELDDDSIELLISYLKSLSTSFSPGVTDTEIHFATITSEGADPGKSKAMLDVLDAFFAAKNAETRLETKRAQHSPWYKEWRYQAYRKWVLHVWDLEGPSGSWPTQLDDRYEEQPVFAVISGIAEGKWQPVHDFCERLKVPCLLPNTQLPGIAEAGYYSVYFSKGMTIEAQAMAKHAHAEKDSRGRIVQVYKDDRAESSVAAEALRHALGAYGLFTVEDRVVSFEDGRLVPPPGDLLRTGSEDWLVLWLDGDDLSRVDGLDASGLAARRIYVSSTLLDGGNSSFWNLPPGRIHTLHSSDLPEDLSRRFRRIGRWLSSKDIEVVDERVQANTLFTATLVAQALKHIGGNFYRDYFLEKIEHILDGMVTPSAYSHLSLAPNQRYASKGCYITKIAAGSEEQSTMVSDWVVP